MEKGSLISFLDAQLVTWDLECPGALLKLVSFLFLLFFCLFCFPLSLTLYSPFFPFFLSLPRRRVRCRRSPFRLATRTGPSAGLPRAPGPPAVAMLTVEPPPPPEDPGTPPRPGF